MFIKYLVLCFFRFHILSCLYSSFRTHFCSPIPYFLLPLLFPTPILSTSPILLRSTRIPFPPLTQKLAVTLKHALCPMGRRTLPFSWVISSTPVVLSPSHVIFRLHSHCHSATVGQLPLLTEAKTAAPAAKATTYIICTSDILADKKALFPFSCLCHLQGH